MCGIAGIINSDGESVDPFALDRMTDALAHRGPDGRGTFVDGNVGFGHRRLAILDLTDAGAQPMRSQDGSVVVTYNGEIYNFQEERKMLETKGYSFRSQCDTEVLIALYQEYGADCVHHLRGMFAFAIYDKDKKQIFCARDRAGQKPFKYFFDGRTLLFASELKALLAHPCCPREIDPEAIHHFLTMMYLPAPLTGFRDIKKLEAGCSLTFDIASGTLTKDRYWQLDYAQEDQYSAQEWEERIRSMVKESVKLRMIADVEVGAFLSGGIDSGAVVMMMAGLSDQQIRTFSIGSAVSAYNELDDAQRIADLAGTQHCPEIVTPDVFSLLPKLVALYEEPYGDASSIPTYYVSQLASQNVKVVLSGDGGDENFAGYVRYPISQFSRLWSRFAFLHPLVRAGTELFHRYMRSTFSYRCHRFQTTMQLPWERRYLQYISYFTEEEKDQIYSTHMHNQSFPRTDQWYADLMSSVREQARDPLHAVVGMDFNTYLPDDLMPKVDMASMHFGLECRAPLLDHHLLEMSARIPASLKLRGKRGKAIFKDALRGMLPDEHLTRRKTGFRLPLDRWFRTELKDVVQDRLLSDTPHKWDFFDRSGIESLLKNYYSSSTDYSDYLWELLWLDEWFMQYAPPTT